jgi:methyl-accepting chemotaxis protein|tara:strand:+ start:86 stop:475 length:390 start_codon:yes stop_codon:yes gene_type:complete
MANDYEIFEGKTLSDVFKDIYDNSKTNKQQLEVLMKEVVGFIKDGDTAVQIIPMLKEYLEINVKNDEQLVKLATVVQRIMAAEGRISNDSGDEFGLTDAEKKQLMDAIEDDVQELQSHSDTIQASLNQD